MRNFLLSLILILGIAPAIKAQDSTLAPPLHIGQLTDTISMHAFKQPEIYAKWWKEIMACSKLKISLTTRRNIQFMYIRVDAFSINNIGLFVGYSFVEDNQLLLIHKGLLNRSLVEHEMLHFLMFHNGIEAGHPDSLFAPCKVW